MTDKTVLELPLTLTPKLSDSLLLINEGETRQVFVHQMDGLLNSYLRDLSGNWQNTFNTTQTLSGRWESVYNNVNSLSSDWQNTYLLSGRWESVYNNVNSLSSDWQNTFNTTQTLSGRWESVYNNVNLLSGEWESVYNNVNSLSSDWQNTFNTTQTLSGRWESVYNNVNSLSSNWNSTDNKAFMVVCTNETANLVANSLNPVFSFRMPYNLKPTEIRATVRQAPVGNSLRISISKSSSPIFSTDLYIDAGQTTSVGSTTPFSFSPTFLGPPSFGVLSDNDPVDIYVEQVGSTTAGTGLKITFK